ncbi:MAG: hypothetical protein KKE24_02965 [Candidatus Thermoplasmatota archaeon]|nr:hypothetical protein [Candidatus Thermoplasmatota archaeon]
MRIGASAIGVAAIALVLLLVSSAFIGAAIIAYDSEWGGMEDRWVYRNLDSYGNERELSWGCYFDSRGNLILDDWSGFLAIDANGMLLWRADTNARPQIVEGPDGGYYYQDWNTSSPSMAAWSNITALDANGEFKWSFVTPNGTLELWGIYPDGRVIAYHHDNEYNYISDEWVVTVDRIIAISSTGSEVWSMDVPITDTIWTNQRVAENGTFEMIGFQDYSSYLVGITKDGILAYIEEGDYYNYPPYRPLSSDGTRMYEVRKEGIDNETTAISVYALSLLNGSIEWKTLLHYSDNPDHLSPGSYQLSLAIVDVEGKLFCDDVDDRYSYSLDPSGAILWVKPFLGIMVDRFHSGGLLAKDDSSIKRIDSDGAVAWRHRADLDGYSFVCLGSDETVYYSCGAEVHALIPSSEPDRTEISLIILVVVNSVAVASYGLVRILKYRQAKES